MKQGVDLLFCGRQDLEFCGDGGSTLGLGFAGVVKGEGGDASDFVEEFADFGFELGLTFVDALEQVGLDTRGVYLEEMFAKGESIAADRGAGIDEAKSHIGEITQRRGGLRDVNELFETKMGGRAEAVFGSKSMGHAGQFGDARFGEPLEEVVGDVREAGGGVTVLLLGFRLFLGEPWEDAMRCYRLS